MSEKGQSHRPPSTAGDEELVSDPTERLRLVVDMVRELSLQTDPQELVSVFRRRGFRLYGGDSSMSLSRRNLEKPYYRITRSTRWNEEVNPWEQRDKLPLLKGGLLGELLYGDEPCILNGICVREEDPAYEYLRDAQSLVCLPLYEGGVGLNMVVRISSQRGYFDNLKLPDAVLEANLFGRATASLVQARRAEAAYAELDYEMQRVAKIQRALLPQRLPSIPGVDLAVHYRTAARAGGDYYDFFDLGDGRWGILIADVSGHGTPAAVVMAITRSIMHSQCHECTSAGEMLAIANDQLARQAERYDSTFVTAFYGIYSPQEGTLSYACAGHCPPLVIVRDGGLTELRDVQTLPLSVEEGTVYPESSRAIVSGDTVLLYTDGITEASNHAGELFGYHRFLECVTEDAPNAQHIIDCITHKVLAFTGNAPAFDDQTLLAMRVE